MTLCSVIVPLYNKAEFVETSLRSILNQRYQQFEIIVVDDGSRDDGAARVIAMHEPRIQLISQTNSGVSEARNRGIKHARGDIVCFLDADDVYHPEYLETIVKMADKFPKNSYFATNYQRFDALTGTLWEQEHEISYQPELIEDFFARWWRQGPFCFTGSIAVRRDTLVEMQPCFPVGESMGEDHDLWFRLAEKYNLVYYKKPLVGYQVGVTGSLCASHKILDLLPAYKRLELRALAKLIPEQHRRDAIYLASEMRVSTARMTLTSGRRLEAFMKLLNAWRCAYTKRWWITLAMCAFFSPGMTMRWERWRHV